MDALKSVQKDQTYIPDDATLLKMYEATKTEKINSVMYQTKRTMIVDIYIIGFCIVLTLTHWWLLRKY